MATLQQLLQRLSQNISSQNGQTNTNESVKNRGAVSQLLLMGSDPSILPNFADSNRLTQLCSQTIHTRPFDQIVAFHFRSLYATSTQQHISAVQLQTQAAEVLYAVMEADKESNWLLPIINVIFRQLRFSSYSADSVLESRGEKTKHMIETQAVLVRYLQKMVIDRAPQHQSKRMGCLFVIVHLFKLYFKLNNLKLCTFLIKMVKQLPSLDTYPKAQVIAYKYYLGRLNVFEEKYEEAEECLSYAFKHCSRQSIGNKRKILQFLIPVKLLKAKYPLEKLLNKYSMDEFKDLIQSINSGSLEQFNTNLEKNQRFYIQKGIYLILEKLKIFVYRNLFRKVHLFHSQTTTDVNSKFQLPLDTLLAALRINGTEMSLDELECILANLIFQGNMKGYIAHKRCVVLSKADPFPKTG